MTAFILRAFCEPSGAPSSTRLMTLVVVASVMGLWVYCGIRQIPMPQMDMNLVALIAAAMGMKVWQRGKEGHSNGESSPPPITKQ